MPRATIPAAVMASVFRVTPRRMEDLWHHTVYTLATGLAYRLLDERA